MIHLMNPLILAKSEEPSYEHSSDDPSDELSEEKSDVPYEGSSNKK